jgi:hypothetical protein
MIKIGILSTHPIQYQSPFHKRLSQIYDVDVYFSHEEKPIDRKKSVFGVEFEWPKEILDGFKSYFLDNHSNNRSVNTFFGTSTPEIIKLIKNSKYDLFIVHGWYTYSYWQAILACKFYKVPILVRNDSTLNEYRNWYVLFLKKIFYRFLMNSFDGFLTVGKNTE